MQAESASASSPRPPRKPTARQLMNRGRGVSPGGDVVLCDDGKYRWVYELNLLTNPTVFLLVWKILFFIFLGIFAVVLASDAIRYGAAKLAENLRFLLYFFLGMTAVTALGYLLYAAVMGGKYCVMFEMDEKGVNHRQMPHQVKKAQALADLTALAGLAAGRPGVAGAGLNASRTEMYTAFADVRRIKAYPARRLIKLNERLSHNQVYAGQEDFDFVLDYITARCHNLKN